MQTYTSQLTWGQGTHELKIPLTTLRAMRSLCTDHYSTSPKAMFCLLTPPTLEPEFALHYSVFQLMLRMFPSAEARRQLDHDLSQLQEPIIDGPYKRFLQIKSHPIFASTYRQFINNTLTPDKWQHDLREDFRKHTWQLLCRDRGQHFGGTSQGVNKQLTTAFLSKWAREADAMSLDPVDIDKDPKVCMKVLRLLLIGGLMSPEREHRHRKRSGKLYVHAV